MPSSPQKVSCPHPHAHFHLKEFKGLFFSFSLSHQKSLMRNKNCLINSPKQSLVINPLVKKLSTSFSENSKVGKEHRTGIRNVKYKSGNQLKDNTPREYARDSFTSQQRGDTNLNPSMGLQGGLAVTGIKTPKVCNSSLSLSIYHSLPAGVAREKHIC